MTVALRNKQVFNVKDYGAVADGVTSDSTAVNNAQAAATAVGGGTVWFPPGTYWFGSTITPSADLAWECQPGSVTLSSGYASTSGAFRMSAGSSLIGFKLISLSTGIVRAANNCLIKNCDFSAGGARVCVYVEVTTNVTNVTIEGCYSDNNNYLVQVSGITGMEDWRIINNRCTNLKGDAIRLTGTTTNSFLIEGNHFEAFVSTGSSSSSGCGLYSDGTATNFVFTNNYVKMRNKGIWLTGTNSKYITICNNVFEGMTPNPGTSQDVAIYIDTGSNVTIENNIVTGWDDYGIGINSTTSGDVIIRNNICYANGGSGILTSHLGSNIVVRDNICNGSTKAATHGIDVRITASISGNICNGNAAYGISWSGSANQIYHNQNANLTYNNATAGTTMSGAGAGGEGFTRDKFTVSKVVTVASNAYPALALFPASKYAKGKLYLSIVQGTNWRWEIWDITFTAATTSTVLTATSLKSVASGGAAISVATITVSGSVISAAWSQTVANGTTAIVNAYFHGLVLNNQAT